MTPRERMMALLAMVMLFFFGGGVLAYQFYLRPMKTADARMRTLKDEIDKNETQLQEITDALPTFALRKKMSLPADPVKARFMYSEQLDKMLRESDYAVGKFSVDPKDVDHAQATGAKKPPFQRLQYNITAKGDEASLIAFLTKFYNMPLLHRIRSIKIDRPITSSAQQGQNELEAKFTIEALIVDGADNRETLLPKDVTPPKRNARTLSQYVSMAGRDIFYGPPPPSDRSTDGVNTNPYGVKLQDCIHLDEITLKDEGTVAEASLYDVWNNKRYMIYSDKYGTIDVKVYYYIKDRKVLYEFGKDLVIKEGESVLMDYKVIRIEPRQLVLESEDQYFTLQAGGYLKDLVALKPEAAKAMGLPVKEKKDKKAETKDKKDEKKVDVEKK